VRSGLGPAAARVAAARARVTAAAAVAAAAALVLAIACAPASAWPGSRVIHVFGSGRPPTIAECLRASASRCYSPAQLRTAYDLRPLLSGGIDGRGTTIVIIESVGSPTIRSDLRTFDRAFGLPPPPQLSVYRPAGRIARFRPGNASMAGWASESTLDVEWSHAFAPRARIVLLETPVNETYGYHGMPQMMAAIRWAVAHKIGDVISMSFGAAEPSFRHASAILRLRAALVAATRRGLGLVSATGDSGATEPFRSLRDFFPFRAGSWPSTDPLVLAAGGTTVRLGAGGDRLAPDIVWHERFAGTGGGRSTVFGRPSYEDPFAPIVGDHRGVPDLSMSASSSDGEDVYASFLGHGGPGWMNIGGTSIATVELAGVIADADQVAGHPIADLPAKVYALSAASPNGIVDVTRGTNTFGPLHDRHGKRIDVRGFTAGPGYDLASGLGTIDAAAFVPALARIG
jgi:subtilase family serine protease